MNPKAPSVNLKKNRQSLETNQRNRIKKNKIKSITIFSAIFLNDNFATSPLFNNNFPNYATAMANFCIISIYCIYICIFESMIATKLALLLCLALTVSSVTVITFDEFITKFNKPYKAGSEEYNQKKAIFDKNVEELKKSDCESCGVTKFFDVSKEDFRKSKLFFM